MDWNWFFAAVAQSFAAIVGVVGALLVARLMAHESARRAWLRDAANWVADCKQQHVQCDSLQTAWLNDEQRRKDEWFQENAEKIYAEEGRLPVDEWVLRLIDGFGWYEAWDTMATRISFLLPKKYVDEEPGAE